MRRRVQESYPDPWWGDQGLRVLPIGIAVAAGGVTLWVRDGQTGVGLLLVAGGAAAAAWAVHRGRSAARHHAAAARRSAVTGPGRRWPGSTG
jgi:hypothetical protein